MEDVGPRDAADGEAPSPPPRRSGPRPRPPQRRSPGFAGDEPAATPDPPPGSQPASTAAGTPTAAPPPAARPAPARTSVAARSPGAPATSAQRARQSGDTGPPHLVRGAGEHFLPLPHARLVDAGGGDSSDVLAITAAGTPVHAICAGTVRHADGGGLRIEGEDGHTCRYSVVRDARVTPGDRVDAGAILGVIGADDAGRHALHLEVVGRDQTPVRPHDLLLGAADPNELGYGPAGTGVDVDPDARTGRGMSPPRPAARTQTGAVPEPAPAVPAAKPAPSAGKPVPPAGRPVAPTRPVRPRPPITMRPAPAIAAEAPPPLTEERPAETPPLTEERPAETPPPIEERPAETPPPVQEHHAAPPDHADPQERVPDEEGPPEPPASRAPLRLPDEQEAEQTAPPAPAQQSAEERRKRAAMLIARNKRRPNDSR